MANSTTTSTTTAVTTKDMKSKLYLSMPRIPPKVCLKTLNDQITCNLCKGYLIDATTIVECLHSFCHSCLTKHLRSKCQCPKCLVAINHVKPNIKPDATLQAIVYKLVPGLYEKELLRRRAFYKLRTKEALEATPEQRGEDTEHLIFGPNESISLMLEYSDNDSAPQNSDDENSNSSHEINSSDQCEDDFVVQLKKPKYLQCPAIFTISNLKKFLLHKFGINPNKFCVEIMYKVKSLALPDHYTLMDVAYIFTWKRDAPMKFLYCVRAAHLRVANIEQSAVMYDLPPKRFSTNSQLTCVSDSTDHELDQSSDADSEVRSERTKESETNGSVLQTPRIEQINSTSDTPKSSLLSSSLSTTSGTFSASLASTSTKLNCGIHATVNGSESQKQDASDKSVKELVSSPTTSGRLENIKIKSEPLSPSPEKTPPTDRRSNGDSPKPNTSKSKSTTDIKPSSPSRTNQDLKDSKEKVKTKSILTDSISKSNDSTTNRSEQKTVTFSDRPSPSSRPTPESKPISIERPKGRLLFNKDEMSKSLSPPLSAENEYDFDQHLLKEEYSTKKDFFEKIHLKPRIPCTDSPLVQLPKMPKTEQKSEHPTNLSKDNNKLVATIPIGSINRPSVSSSNSGSTDKQVVKKTESKASKRKSREPVKNVPKVKCVSPNERTIDTKWDPLKSTIVSSVSPSSPVSTATTSNASTTSSSSNNSDRFRRLQESPVNSQRILAGAMSQQNKNHLKSIQATGSTTKSNQASSTPSTPSNFSLKSVFKTPSSSKESSSQSTGLKQAQAPTSESTSIIINNVQRPNQADTPRPSMSFKPNLSQPQPFYISPKLNRNFLNETEIQEIRNDGANKQKVYGPSMSLDNQFESPLLAGPVGLLTGLELFQLYPNRLKPQLPFPTYNQTNPFLTQLNNSQLMDPLSKVHKPKKSTNDTKKPSNFDSRANSLQKTFHPPETSKPQIPHALIPQHCRIPSSLSITLTNDESESVNRSIFNTKNSDVVNSIEIVKLGDESNNEPNAKFPSSLPSVLPSSSTSSSNADKPWQLNKNQQTNQTDSASLTSKDSQRKFLLSFDPLKNLKKPKLPQLQKQSIQPYQNLSNEEKIRNQEIKRKLPPWDEKSAKVRKLQLTTPQQKSSPTTQRPVPDLLIPKDDKKGLVSNNSGSLAQSSSGADALADRQSPKVPSNVPLSDKATSLTLAVAQAKVQPNEISMFSSTPMWTKHCTPEQLANHKTLVENLSQNKKNAGTFVD